jgi:hypothetical protein
MTTAYVLILMYVTHGNYAVTTPVTYTTEQACESVGKAALKWAVNYKCVEIKQ